MAAPRFAFDNSYVQLPERFYSLVAPTPVRAPGLLKVNRGLARELGLDPAELESPEGLAVLAGNQLPNGAQPLAQVYAGHQFGGWVPQLGDGRAILLGEVIDVRGIRRDIQLKGSGPTPYSRRGDGRAWVGPVLREYLVSEAMHALGVPTTRALAAVSTGESVYREEEWPGAVLTRVATSHIRVGTFQYFAARDDRDGLRALSEHALLRHYPGASGPLALLEHVVEAQAKLVAQWLSLGFIHGVMNTDNTSVGGETIDYGPCAFLDTYHPDTVFSSIDVQGRYAYAAQPQVMLWNLAQLANALLPILAEDRDEAIRLATAALDRYAPLYGEQWLLRFRAKLGLVEAREGDRELAEALLKTMAQNKADFTRTFRGLSDGSARAEFQDPAAFDRWAEGWRQRAASEGSDDQGRAALMASTNPAFHPRNHRIEEAIQAAVAGNLQPFERLLTACTNPFTDQPEYADLQLAPKPHEVVEATFCGT